MLRALGMYHRTLVELIVGQSVYFSVPAILLGLLIAWCIYAGVAAYLAYYTILPIELVFHGQAIAMGVVLGFCMPLISTLIPTRV
jgi:ABC-type antimicrobial peptide transport system permease subunit